MLRVLSLGAGVQSTTMALMAAHGEFEVGPDVAIFADTGAEPQPVYDHLRFLMSGNVLSFPVYIVSAGNIRDDLITGGKSRNRFVVIPYFLDKENGEVGMGRRQCTREYKIDPLGKKVRELLGYQPRQRIPAGSAEVWIGISVDEAIRMKPSRVKWQDNRWPLIEKRMTRADCYAWLERNGYPRPPKSACTFCPYRSNESWRGMKKNDPASFADACAVDVEIRNKSDVLRLKAKPYIHRSLVPLGEADLHDPSALGQADLFGNDCEGMCGV